jgi:hypothetical protein
MATNILGHVDKRRYNPSRDIAYCWPWIMRAAMDRIASGTGEAWALSFIDKNKISDEELLKTAKALATFMAMCNKPEECPNNPKEAAQASGLFDCSPDARTLAYAAMGETMLAAFYLGIRDVLVEDEPSPLNDKRFEEQAVKAANNLCLGNKSFLGRILRKISSWF